MYAHRNDSISRYDGGKKAIWALKDNFIQAVLIDPNVILGDEWERVGGLYKFFITSPNMTSIATITTASTIHTLDLCVARGKEGQFVIPGALTVQDFDVDTRIVINPIWFCKNPCINTLIVSAKANGVKDCIDRCCANVNASITTLKINDAWIDSDDEPEHAFAFLSRFPCLQALELSNLSGSLFCVANVLRYSSISLLDINLTDTSAEEYDLAVPPGMVSAITKLVVSVEMPLSMAQWKSLGTANGIQEIAFMLFYPLSDDLGYIKYLTDATRIYIYLGGVDPFSMKHLSGLRRLNKITIKNVQTTDYNLMVDHVNLTEFEFECARESIADAKSYQRR